MKKILVTGGAGFIGSHFVKHVLRVRPEIQIVNLDLLTYAGNLETLAEIEDNPRHKFVKGSILDSTLTQNLATDCQCIINFAAESHVDRSISGPEAFVETNIVGTLKLLETAKLTKTKRFLQISTDEVYGSLGPSGVFSEDTPLAPNSPYSASKASADLLCRSYFHTYGFDIVITRCSNNYGPFQFPEKLVPLMIMNASQDKPLPVYGDGLNIRDWIYVEDHCAAILAVLERGTSGQVYNVGSDNEWTNIDIVKKILFLTKKPESLIKFVTDRPGHDRRYAIESGKIKSELGWKPVVSFEEGLKKTVEWYQSQITFSSSSQSSSKSNWLTHVTSGEYQNYYNSQYGSQ